GGTLNSGVLTWNLGTVAAGTSGSVTLAVQLDSVFPNGTTPISNSAVLSSNESGPTPSDTTTTTVTAAPSLSVTKAVDKTIANPGDTLTFTLSYSNVGNADASGVAISDTLPPRTTFVSATGNASISGNVVTWSIGA